MRGGGAQHDLVDRTTWPFLNLFPICIMAMAEAYGFQLRTFHGNIDI